MEREVGDSAHIAITLMLIAALITVVWYTVTIGRSVEEKSINTGVRIVNQMDSSQLSSINDQDAIEIPKVAAYNIVVKESEYISRLVYKVNNTTYTVEYKGDSWKITPDYKGKNSLQFIEDILVDNLSGRINISVSKNSVDGKYIINLEEVQ